MSVSVTVLASGSKGNSTLISCGATRLLVDAGLSCRETKRRLKLAGEDPGALTAVIISHEHSDHVSGLPAIAKNFDVPAYLTESTYAAWAKQWRDAGGEGDPLPRKEFFRAGHKFSLGEGASNSNKIEVTPFTIPHDAADPVGFRITAQGVTITIVTDLGYMPPSVRDQLAGCDVMIIESNHDLEMLRGGPYPWSVKQRVLSRVGHLSNDALADFFSGDYDGNAAFLILAHISAENNHPEVARRAAEKALESRPSLLQSRGRLSHVLVASQTEPLDTIRL